ncbi:MAG: flavodoxin-dependent (E)-4-hydroxy-3-methylbut-2-enyl-diphosphate synthase [Patescibacteria group bacterium]
MTILRRTSHPVTVGGVVLGGGASVVVQSMTNTDTSNIEATVLQIIELASAGAELVRVTVNDEAAALAVPMIKAELVRRMFFVPLVGDFHFNGHLLLEKFPACARSLDKYRINPGTVGKLENFEKMIVCAIRYGKPVRIGANWGSLEGRVLKKDADVVEVLVDSALAAATHARQLGLSEDKIILSVKTSEVTEVIRAYRMLARRCSYPLHVGLTEAGAGVQGVVSSSAALGILLSEGIGDTIRMSLTPSVGEPRTREVEACRALLQSLGMAQFEPKIVSCPGCGRTENARFQELADDVREFVSSHMPVWREHVPGVEFLKVAIMGCVVNGPGEAGHADIALSLPGKSEEPIATVFVRGKLLRTLRGGDIGAGFLKILQDFVENDFLKEK